MRIKKIIAGVIAFLLIGFILFLANAFMGNPISKMMVNQAAEKYVEQNYPDLDLELEDASFNFKDGYYNILAKSTTSIDTHFYLYFSNTGKYMHDEYETSVLNKFNTWQRVDEKYRSLVDTVLENDFPYESDIAFGEIPDHDDDSDFLEIDKKYDIKELGKERGHIILYINSDHLAPEVIATTLLDIKQLFDQKQVPFYSIDLTLQEHSNEGKQQESIMVKEFLYKDITEDGLEEKVNENIKTTKEYFEEMDKQFEAEIDGNNN